MAGDTKSKGGNDAAQEGLKSSIDYSDRPAGNNFQINHKSGNVKEIRVVDTIHPPPPRDHGDNDKI